MLCSRLYFKMKASSDCVIQGTVCFRREELSHRSLEISKTHRRVSVSLMQGKLCTVKQAHHNNDTRKLLEFLGFSFHF
jgi:hypothetical protein